MSETSENKKTLEPVASFYDVISLELSEFEVSREHLPLSGETFVSGSGQVAGNTVFSYQLESRQSTRFIQLLNTEKGLTFLAATVIPKVDFLLAQGAKKIPISVGRFGQSLSQASFETYVAWENSSTPATDRGKQIEAYVALAKRHNDLVNAKKKTDLVAV